MKKRLLSIMLCAIVLIGTYAAGIIMPVNAATEANDSEKIYCDATLNDDYAPDSVLVVMNTLTSLKFHTYSAEDFSEIKAKNVSHITAYSESVVQKALNSAETAAAFGSTIVEVEPVDLSTYRQVLYVELEDTGKDKVLEAIKELEKRDDVLYVGPDYYLEPCSDTSTQTYEAYFEDQWAYDKIELGEAWDEIDTSSEVLVGIMDSGIDGDHPDLEGRIDSSLSCDFAYLYGNTGNETNDQDDDPLEDDDNHKNHGTKVAGIIAGICDNAKLVSLKIMEGVTLSSGDGGGAKYRSSYACRAIEYAERNNIKILCMSVAWAGSSASGEFDNDGYGEPMNSVFDQYSGLLICSAGNHYRNIDDNDAEWDIYPQQYDDDLLLVVGASTDKDAIWYNPDTQKGSNVGIDSVDLFAPGTDIATTVKGGGRGTMTGTSVAAPMVAGVAAMILSMYPDLSENMIKIKEYIVNYVDGSLSGVTAFTWKCDSGGRLNAFKAVEAAIDDNTPDAPEPCQHEGDVYYTQYNDTSHRVKCYDCDEVLETVAHEGYNTNYGSSGHQFYCNVCRYSAMRDHDIYISAVNNGVYTIKCHGCSYVRNCSCGCEFEPDGDMGHDLTCMDCNYSIFEDHMYELSGDYDSSGHKFECIYCYYSEYVDHNLYMDSAESGEYVVKCYDCNYSVECWEEPVYYGNSDDGHSMSCPDGCYSFFEAHTYTYTDTGNGTHTVTCDDCGYTYSEAHTLRRVTSGDLYTHIVECTVCDYESTESHTWVSYGTGYRCSVCKMLSDSPPIIMSLPDPELEAYLASLSEEEREEFIASLPEDQVDRVTALLPSDDEHLTE